MATDAKSLTPLDRKSLYEDIWTTPMSRLATKYGISGGAIRKLCDKLQVPVPPRGHWARVESGYAVVRLPLPDLVERVVRPKKVGRPRDPTLMVLDQVPPAKSVARASVPIFPTPAEPMSWHPALKRVRTEIDVEVKNAKQLRVRHDWQETNPGKQYPYRDQTWGSWTYFCDRGQLLCERHKKSPVRLSFVHYQRGLIILNMVCELAAKEGYEVQAKEDGSRIQFFKAQAHVDVRVSEKLDTDSRSEMNSWDKSIRTVKRLQPTGRLAVFFEQQGVGHTEVADKPGQPLEMRIAELKSAMERRYECSVAMVERWAEREREYEEVRLRREEDAQRKMELERRAAEERRLSEALLAEVDDWRRAEYLRSYIASIDKEIAEAQTSSVPPRYADWRAWALQVADELDKRRCRVQGFFNDCAS